MFKVEPQLATSEQDYFKFSAKWAEVERMGCAVVTIDRTNHQCYQLHL
jgi:hypothetical protein